MFSFKEKLLKLAAEEWENAQKLASDIQENVTLIASDIQDSVQAIVTENVVPLTEQLRHTVLFVEDDIKNQEEENKAYAATASTGDSSLSINILPWEASVEDESHSILSSAVMERILLIPLEVSNLTEPPPDEAEYEFDFDAYVKCALRVLQVDRNLAKVHAKLIARMDEKDFWRNYFYRVAVLRAAAGLEPMKPGVSAIASEPFVLEERPQPVTTQPEASKYTHSPQLPHIPRQASTSTSSVDPPAAPSIQHPSSQQQQPTGPAAPSIPPASPSEAHTPTAEDIGGDYEDLGDLEDLEGLGEGDSDDDGELDAELEAQIAAELEGVV